MSNGKYETIYKIRSMEFNHEIASTLLHLVSIQSPEVLLKPSLKVHSDNFGLHCEQLIPKTLSPADVMGYLLVLSHSGLIYPPLSLEPLKKLIDDIPSDLELADRYAPELPENPPLKYISYNVLHGLLENHFLTVDGYNLLQKYKKDHPDNEEHE